MSALVDFELFFVINVGGIVFLSNFIIIKRELIVGKLKQREEDMCAPDGFNYVVIGDEGEKMLVLDYEFTREDIIRAIRIAFYKDCKSSNRLLGFLGQFFFAPRWRIENCYKTRDSRFDRAIAVLHKARAEKAAPYDKEKKPVVALAIVCQGRAGKACCRMESFFL
jgi:hypothetical protein